MKAMVVFNFKRSRRLLNQRRTEDGMRLAPSLGGFNAQVIDLNHQAIEGDPFAIEVLKEIEDRLEVNYRKVREGRAAIQREINALGWKVTGIEPHYHIPFQTNRRYCAMSFAVVGLISLFDKLCHDRVVATKMGIIDRLDDLPFMRLEKSIAKIKIQPKRYKRLNIRSFKDKGTLEWTEAVKTLGKQPVRRPYRPKYHFDEKPTLVAKTQVMPVTTNKKEVNDVTGAPTVELVQAV